jgi:plastocyanin
MIQENQMRKLSWIVGAALSAALGTAAMADITGKVTLNGKVADADTAEITAIKANAECAKMHKDPVFMETVVTGNKDELANVIVSIKTPQGKELKGGKPPQAVLDQKGCVYVPHVVAVQVGQPIVTKNSDATLHNVHTLPLDNNAVNKGMPGGASPINLGPFPTVETFKVKCDVHPWMVAWIRVLDNPFYAVTDDQNGAYKIDTTGLPDGDYELVFWHEKFGEQTQKISVKGGKAEANAVFNTAKKAEAPAGGIKETKVAALMTDSAQKCEDGSCCEVPSKAAALLTAAKAK